jgi:energy-coupling factor transporter transmembrane protein EcfT
MIEFGAYTQADTVAHRLHPAAKVTFTLAFLAGLALAGSPTGVGIFAAITAAVLAICRTTPRQVLKILKPMRWLMLFVFIIDIAFCGWQNGSTTVALPAALASIAQAVATTAAPASDTFAITLSFSANTLVTGIIQAFLNLTKFACAMLGAAMLMRTTTPTALADAAAIMLRPLTPRTPRAATALHSATFALQTTFRFVPVLLDEFHQVKQAQTERGAFNLQNAEGARGLFPANPANATSETEFDAKNSACHPSPAHLRQKRPRLLAKVRAYIPVIVPVFESALRRSDALAQAVHNRGFTQTGTITPDLIVPPKVEKCESGTITPDLIVPTCIRVYAFTPASGLTVVASLAVLAAGILL